jgi:hypothetical protein
MFQMGQGVSYTFYSVGSINSRKLYQTSYKNKDLLYSAAMVLGQTGLGHTRIRYGLFSYLADLGGILEILTMFLGFLLFPLSEHSFIIKAANKFFFARTNRDDVFMPQED